MDTAIGGKLVQVEEALNRRELERHWAQHTRIKETIPLLCLKQIETEAKEPTTAAKSSPGSK